MLRQIVLHGKLKELYHGDIYFDVSSVSEAVRACCYQIDGFEDCLKEGYFRVCLGENDPANDIDESVAPFILGNSIDTIHFVPVIAGAKGGAGKAILGVALIGVAAVFTGGIALGAGGLAGISGTGAVTGSMSAGLFGTVIGSGTIAKLGIAMVLGGVSSLLAPKVKSDTAQSYERPDQRPSFLFNGPVNTAEQGGPVPLVYGRVRVGSVVVSSGLNTENI